MPTPAMSLIEARTGLLNACLLSRLTAATNAYGMSAVARFHLRKGPAEPPAAGRAAEPAEPAPIALPALIVDCVDGEHNGQEKNVVHPVGGLDYDRSLNASSREIVATSWPLWLIE